MGIPIVSQTIMDTEGRLGLTVAGQKGTNWAIRSVVYTLLRKMQMVKPKIVLFDQAKDFKLAKSKQIFSHLPVGDFALCTHYPTSI